VSLKYKSENVYVYLSIPRKTHKCNNITLWNFYTTFSCKMLRSTTIFSLKWHTSPMAACPFTLDNGGKPSKDSESEDIWYMVSIQAKQVWSQIQMSSASIKIEYMVDYLPLRLGVKPISKHRDTDMRREATTVTTALSAKPHFDFTISILPERICKPKLIDDKCGWSQHAWMYVWIVYIFYSIYIFIYNITRSKD